MVCKSCRSEVRRDGRKERYARAEKTLLLQIAQNIRTGQRHPGHATLYRLLSNFLGGSRGIAESFHLHYKASMPGSRQAVALLGTLLRLGFEYDEINRAAEEKKRQAVAALPNDELDQSVDEMVRRYLDQQGMTMVPKASG